MPIPRHLKHPIALWIIDSRREMTPPLKPADIARVIGVTEATARAWETARAGQTTRLPSADNLDAMSRLFGRPAPGRSQPTDTDLAAAIRDQTRAIDALVAHLDTFVGPLGEVVADMLREKVGASDRIGSGGASS
jgi:transcriptional regulator with XRE-family HTH domain